MDDFDTSRLRWWRCTAIDSTSKIHMLSMEIDASNVYKEFNKIRKSLSKQGLRFVEAKPMTDDEALLAAKLSQFKVSRQKQLRGIIGRHYSPFSHWPVVLFVVLSCLLILLLACLRLST
jgi:hypothetical protein